MPPGTGSRETAQGSQRTSPQPDLSRIRRSYEGYRARIFDLFGDKPTRSYRRLAIERLDSQQGATVMDLGCGTGLGGPTGLSTNANAYAPATRRPLPAQ